MLSPARDPPFFESRVLRQKFGHACHDQLSMPVCELSRGLWVANVCPRFVAIALPHAHSPNFRAAVDLHMRSGVH